MHDSAWSWNIGFANYDHSLSKPSNILNIWSISHMPKVCRRPLPQVTWELLGKLLKKYIYSKPNQQWTYITMYHDHTFGGFKCYKYIHVSIGGLLTIPWYGHSPYMLKATFISQHQEVGNSRRLRSWTWWPWDNPEETTRLKLNSRISPFVV